MCVLISFLRSCLFLISSLRLSSVLNLVPKLVSVFNLVPKVVSVFNLVPKVVVCSTSGDGDAIIWDMDTGVILRTLEKHPRAVYGASFLGQEQEYLVATVCFDQKTRVYDMRDKRIVAQLQGHTDNYDLCA